MPENKPNETDLRQASRESILEIWDRYKHGKSGELDSEQRVILSILKQHEHDYGHVFDNKEDASNKEYAPGKEPNPFLHISLHVLIDNQLSQKEPIEVVQFYNSLKKKDVPVHRIQHHLMAIVFPLILKAINSDEPFNIASYKTLLKKLKGKHPDKIQGAIDRETASVVI